MPKTLLLADDSVTIQKVVGISFASEDVTLVTVDNGDDALARAKETKPDLILADVVMPGKNGYEVCEAVKADPELAHIPVLLLTGTFEAFDEERASRAGAAGHVSKPFEAQTLVDQAKRLLAESHAPVATPAPAPAPAAPISIETAPPVDVAPAPAPEAPISIEAEAPVDVAPALTPALDDSFDFFDDEAQELSTPTMPDAERAAPAGDSLEIDSPESAFAFGDEDLSPPEPAPSPLSGLPLDDLPAGDRTVAILPDDPAPLTAPQPAGDDPLMGFADDDLSPLESALDDSPPQSRDDSGPLEPVAPAAAADFDFDFESETPVPSDSASTPPLVPVDAADLAQATILDPNGASGYDVSSSDLGDPLAIGPSPAATPASPVSTQSEARPAPQASSDPFDISAPTEPPVEQSHTGLTAEPMPEPLAVEPMAVDPMSIEPMPVEPMSVEPMAAEPMSVERMRQPLGVDPSPFESMDPTEPSPAAVEIAPSELPPPIPEVTREPESHDALLEAEPLPDIEDPIMMDSLPSASLEGDLATAATASVDQAIEEIAPKLRAQLHDTLEKIAWESFSDLTETIVRQAVERVEQVAWEVIPQLAETLVREEIRRMKGEDS